jgi:N-acetylmuramoyl-L-alanine amidase-like protein/zinc carboxypeptidase
VIEPFPAILGVVTPARRRLLGAAAALAAGAAFATVLLWLTGPVRGDEGGEGGGDKPSSSLARNGKARPAGPQRRRLVVGRSVKGRPIHATRVGDPRTPRKVLVVGAIHGGELAGRAVTRRLRSVRAPAGVELWLLDDLNPDGAARGSRQNAHGVDLNRNFPYRWRATGRPFSTFHAGPGPLSEPESRAAAELIERIRPRVTIWYHQALRLVTRTERGDRALERLYASRSGLPHRRLPPFPGTASAWQNARFQGTAAFVAELAGGRLSRRSTLRHARAVLAVARAIAPPRVRRRPIPFGRQRKEEMRRYSARHYGIDDFRLRDPKVIVQHYTATDDFASVFNTFAPDRPDRELHELPGVCSHYVIDRNGRIYQLVSTRIMCRHTVGLNHTAIGIEHVGRSDGQVLANRRQLRSSLALTRRLQGRYGIRTRNVIGHNESLSSPYHRERVARLRSQTHGDFRRPSMRRYRRALARLPAPAILR